MEKIKHTNKILSGFLAILLIASSLIIIGVFNTASAAVTPGYGDLMQEEYAYPVGPGGNSANTFFNAGPAPNTPTIKWTQNRAGLGFTAGTLAGTPPVAFDGKVYCHSSSSSGQSARLYAIHPQTGNLVWYANITSTPRGFGTSTYFQVDATHIGWEYNNGVEIHSTVDGSMTGYLRLNDTDNGFNRFGGGSVVYWGGFYSSWDKLKYSTAAAQPGVYTDPATGVPIDTVRHVAVAVDCSDPSDPQVKWTWVAPTGIESLGSAPGLAIFGGYGEGEIYALNATNGQLVWKQFKNGNAGYACNYYEGRIYHSASSTTLTCYNATTGEILFDQDEGGRAFFVFGDALAYGRYFGKNIALPNGYVGAWDAYTGTPLWKTPALYNIAYLIPQVADGKVYVMRYSGTAGGEESQGSVFACFDAFTGDILWELPGVNWAEPMIAYGNLYAISGGTLYCLGDDPQPYPEFHGGDINNPGLLPGRVGPADISVPLWRFGDVGSISGSAVAANGKVYFGSLDNNIYCIDAYTGASVWNFTTGYRVASTPAVVGGVVYTGADDGNVYALNANTGEKIWERFVGGQTGVFWVSAWQVRSSPQVDGGQVFVGALDGNLYCLSAASGSIIWAAAAGNVTYPIGGTPLINSDTVYIASGDSYLYAFNRANGNLLWSTQMQPTTGFDIRAFVSTPVLDEGTLWICTDTRMLTRVNATTGEMMNQITLPYSRGGTMTPAVTTPAIATVGSGNNARKILYVGDGFQLDAFDITSIEYSPQVSVNVSTINDAYYWHFENGTTVFLAANNDLTATYNHNVNVDVNSTSTSSIMGNETDLPMVWARWLGHQVYSSPVVVTDLRGTKVYFGDDVYSITVINGSAWVGQIITDSVPLDLRGGNPLSVYTTKGQVFASACIYDGRLYMGSQDGYMYAFGDQVTNDFYIYGASNKGDEMWNNEVLQIEGRLQPTTKTYNDPQGDPTNLGSYDTNFLPNATIILSLNKPDGSSENVTTTTDNYGYYSFSYSPTAVGLWGWVAFYEGEAKPWITYNAAYTDFNTINVVPAPGTTPSPTIAPTPTPSPTVAPTASPEPTATPAPTVVPSASPTAVPTASPTAVPTTAAPTVEPTSTPTSGGLAIEYIYAAIAVIVIVVIIVAAYMYMRRK